MQQGMFEKMDGWKTIDLGLAFQSLVDHWLEQVPVGDDPSAQLENAKAQIEALKAQVDSLEEKLPELQAAVDSGEEIQVDPGEVIKDLFASEQEVEDQSEAASGGETSPFGNVDADDADGDEDDEEVA